jgi:hypothetical protein
MVMFFGGVSRSIKVIECEPAAFASELARRWQERHPSPVGPAGFDAAAGTRGLRTDGRLGELFDKVNKMLRSRQPKATRRFSRSVIIVGN